jgi:hypothetical protein
MKQLLVMYPSLFWVALGLQLPLFLVQRPFGRRRLSCPMQMVCVYLDVMGFNSMANQPKGNTP